MNAELFINDIPASIALQAHVGTSWTPESRAEHTRKEYANTLAADYASLQKLATTSEKQTTLDAEFAIYRTRFAERYRKYLFSRARCVSWAIAGPSNFPAAQMEKRFEIADRRLNEVLDFRNRALEAIRRTLTPELRPIMTGDSNAGERLAEEIARAEELQTRMKAANTAIRKHAKSGESAQIEALAAIGFSADVAAKLLKPDCVGRVGFPDFKLTNNAANIRRMKARLEHVQRLATIPNAVREGRHARLEDCPSENRVRLIFPGKPEEAVRSQLKSSGFRWTPSLGCWQAYRNPHAMEVARTIAGLDAILQQT